MRGVASLLFLLMISSTIGGCLWWEEEVEEVIESGPFSFEQAIPITTWYHYPGSVSAPWAVDATDGAARPGRGACGIRVMCTSVCIGVRTPDLCVSMRI